MERLNPPDTTVCNFEFFHNHFFLIPNLSSAFITNPHMCALHSALVKKPKINSMKQKSIFRINFGKTSRNSVDSQKRVIEERLFITRRWIFSFLCLLSCVLFERQFPLWEVSLVRVVPVALVLVPPFSLKALVRWAVVSFSSRLFSSVVSALLLSQLLSGGISLRRLDERIGLFCRRFEGSPTRRGQLRSRLCFRQRYAGWMRSSVRGE